LASQLLAAASDAAEPIIDIHQHLDYSGRTDDQLLTHQAKLGITHTILLPAGRFYGLEAKCAGNERVQEFSQKHRQHYWHFANEVPYLSEARTELQKYLKTGGIGIGEQKFMVDADSGAVQLMADIAKEFGVPVLLHFQHGRYNMEFERFHKILERYPQVNFIGHAQTWWANIDAKAEQPVLYPKGPVTAGGLTDKWLADYPNMFADMSAGSGLNAFLRDEQHARGFIDRHQNKLLFGSDCSDAIAEGDKCLGAQIIAMIRHLSPNKTVERKLLFENSRKLFKLG
jgi:predicted TIM-barrel fold metal-dependent hydrolase